MRFGTLSLVMWLLWKAFGDGKNLPGWKLGWLAVILSAIPVIFVTALNQPEDETRALEAGAVDFISKPFNAAVVRARVRIHLSLVRLDELLQTFEALRFDIEELAEQRIAEQEFAEDGSIYLY